MRDLSSVQIENINQRLIQIRKKVRKTGIKDCKTPYPSSNFFIICRRKASMDRSN